MNRTGASDQLVLGSNVVEKLVPFRRPLLMVDGILSYARGPLPRMRAWRQISANEPVFEGHFPDVHVWPGIYTQEGLGQTSALLKVVLGLQRGYEEDGRDQTEVLEALRNLERGYKLHPGFDPEAARAFLAVLPRVRCFMEMSGAVEMKFLRPVFAGQRLEYEATIVKEYDRMMRVELEGTVEGEPVARGTMTSTFVYLRPPDEHGR